MKNFALIEDGVVVNVIVWDGEGDLGIGQLVESDVAQIGDRFDGTNFIPPEPPAPPVVTEDQATAERDRLMAYATAQIAPLQDAVDMEEATEVEVTLLLAWKKYRLAVSRTSTSPSWPSAVQWPEMPA